MNRVEGDGTRHILLPHRFGCCGGSIVSSFTINFIYGLICMAVTAAACIILAVVLAAIMKTFALAPAYVFIAGAVLCAIILALFVFVAAHFFLWLPCAEITGFRMSEALYYSYAQAKTVRWRNFAAIALPLDFAVCGVFGHGRGRDFRRGELRLRFYRDSGCKLYGLCRHRGHRARRSEKILTAQLPVKSEREANI